MGLFGELLGAIGEGVAEGLAEGFKDMNAPSGALYSDSTSHLDNNSTELDGTAEDRITSNSSMVLDYTSPTTEDIKYDHQYLALFREVLLYHHKICPKDTYIRELVQRFDGNAIGAFECGDEIRELVQRFDGNAIGTFECGDMIRIDEAFEHVAVWFVYYNDESLDKDNENGRSIVIRLHTPFAKQLDNKGNLIKPGCTYEVGGKLYQAGLNVVNELRDNEMKKRNDVKLESFLGVKFGDDYRKYEVKDAEHHDCGNGLILNKAAMNHFLEFETYFVLRPFNGNNVIGALCHANRDNIEDVGEFVENLRSILEEKYHRKFDGEISFDNEEEGNGDETKKRIEMSFYKDELKEEGRTHSISINVDHDSIDLIVVDVVSADKVIKDSDAETAKNKKQARKAALDAL